MMTTIISRYAFVAVLLISVFYMPNVLAGEKPISKQDARALVQPFYDMLSGKDTEALVRQNLTNDWVSYSSNTAFDDLDYKMKFFKGPLLEMIPDINWSIVDLQVTPDNHIIVRGEGSGTPAGDSFFGTPVDGKSFTLMSIDIHEVKNGKITKSYHIEDWLGALGQVRAK